MKGEFKKTSFFSVPKKELFQFHEHSDAFSILTPKSENIDVLSTASTLAPSDETVRFVVDFLGVKLRFENTHTIYKPYDLFVDEQKKGLFSKWRHEHHFFEAGWKDDPASMLEDHIFFEHPLLFSLKPFVAHKLNSLFAYRHRETAKYLNPGFGIGSGKTAIVTGATGLIGKRITEILVEKGCRVIAFVRNPEKAQELLNDNVTPVRWDFTRPDNGDLRTHIDRADVIIHLAGTPLFKQRWTPEFKKQMEQSRVLGTRQLVEAVLSSQKKPEAFISGSALGYYGKSSSWIVDEETEPGNDLLADICVAWENEALKPAECGIRTVLMRTGIVLSTESGALKEVLPLFKTGLGGVMGAPTPYINWIHLEDICRMFVMAAFNPQMQGPYNGVAPNPVTNETFAKEIGRALHRPVLMKYPISMLKAAIGEAGEYASGGPRTSCDKIEQAGYSFFFEDLPSALRNLL